jgi:putative component of membrane protein insertase Oxa1/YidC/SpoIIIJ protein YidD
MQATQRGIVFNSIKLLSPLAHVAQTLGFRSIADRIVLKGVRAYQQYLSPHKGFCCAYRKLHETESCSEFFRLTVQKEGLIAAIPQFQERLTDCKQAYLILKAQAAESQEDGLKQGEKDKFRDKNCLQSDWANNCANDWTCLDCGSSAVDCGTCDASEPGFCAHEDFGACDAASSCGDCGTCDMGSGCGDCSGF